MAHSICKGKRCILHWPPDVQDAGMWGDGVTKHRASPTDHELDALRWTGQMIAYMGQPGGVSLSF